MTKLLGVIGDPISHSLSPLIHNGWMRDNQIDATYEAMHVPDGSFADALKTLETRNILGVNVTLPHKHAALAAAAETTVAAARIGAANTLTLTQEKTWHADNTDAPGFLTALGKIDPEIDRAVILGAGGSARAIVFALTNAKIPLTVLNRTESKADMLVAELGGSRAASGALNQYTEYIESATIVINTTSMGYSGDALTLSDGSGRLFFDISYGAAAASQLNEARQTGWEIRDGLTMLVAQAAYSFQSWFGLMPDLDRALERCRNALKATQ